MPLPCTVTAPLVTSAFAILSTKTVEPTLSIETVDPPLSTDAPIHEVLRAATHAVHRRLHDHSALAAVQTGTIDRTAYIALLCRLYGFHQPFEINAEVAPDRTAWLHDDLAALGVDIASLARLPRCAAFRPRISPDYLLGARYVVEGSALGGRGLARQLDPLLGAGVTAGRQYFSGHGADTGMVWRRYLAQLAAASSDPMNHAAIVAGATATFAIFEQWLGGWNDGHE